jgi:hypothetical protein
VLTHEKFGLKASAFSKCIGVSYTGISLHGSPSRLLPGKLKPPPGHKPTSLSFKKRTHLVLGRTYGCGARDWPWASLIQPPSRSSGKNGPQDPWYIATTRTQRLPFVVILRRSLEHLIDASYCIRMRSRPPLGLLDPQICCPSNFRSTTTHRHCLRTTRPTLAICHCVLCWPCCHPSLVNASLA